MVTITRPDTDVERLLEFLDEENPSPPSRLSDLIDLAVKDARSLERSTHTPMANVWVSRYPETCRFCLAGAVVIGTLGMQEMVKTGLGDMISWCPDERSEWFDALASLDCIRGGLYQSAFMTIYQRNPTSIECEVLGNLPKPDTYQTDFSSWEELDSLLDLLEGVARELRAHGL